MPARDHSLQFRQGLVELLRANAGLTALVDQRIYGERPVADPAWPYVLIGVPIAGPYAPSRLAGSDLGLFIHCFARGPSADEAYRITAAVVAAIDTRALMLPGGVTCPRIAWQSSDVITDMGSPTDWHGLVRISALTAELI